MKYMKIRMETQKFLFFQILNLKTKVKIKPVVANTFYINAAKEVILVERLSSFVAVLTRHYSITLVWISTKISTWPSARSCMWVKQP